jgi:hypothetical protein
MKEAIGNLIERADLRPSEVIAIGGLLVTVTSTIFSEQTGGGEGLPLYALIFTITSGARNLGVQLADEISFSLSKRREEKKQRRANATVMFLSGR